MYYSCHCIKRNGLQHDCRRTGCGGEPGCLVLPDPVCPPAQLARARGLADPAPFAAHMQAQAGGGAPGGASADAGSGSGGGKRFIVCELKGILPDVAADKSGKCCKCPTSVNVPTQSSGGKTDLNGGMCSGGTTASKKVPMIDTTTLKCPCSSGLGASNNQAFIFDEKTIEKILQSFDKKELSSENNGIVIGPGGRPRKAAKPVSKEEPCSRPGCVHWKPPPPCMWDAPCKADCFEAHPVIQPGRNPLTHGGAYAIGGRINYPPRDKMKVLQPECSTSN